MMIEPAIQVNLQSSPRIKRVGDEQTPVIIFDEFAENAASIVQHACESVVFGPDTVSMYPGVRTALPKSHVIAVLKPLVPLLQNTYSIPRLRKPRPMNYVYSLVSKDGEDLNSLQRIPHADSGNPYYLAITHYLGQSDHGGTGIFRHRPTGFENITESRQAEYTKSVDDFFDANGEPPQEYIAASNEQYELIETIEYQPNRLVIYPGTLLHSGLIKPSTDISADPGRGRLTANIFVDFL